MYTIGKNEGRPARHRPDVKKKRKKTSPKKRSRLSPALRERANALAKAAKARVREAAHDAFARAQVAFEEQSRNLYELGAALAVLKKPGHAEAVGAKDGFYPFCEEHFRLKKHAVDRLLSAVAHLPRERYAKMGAEQVDARLDLALATDDTRAILRGERVRLWKGGPWFDSGPASSRELRDTAKRVRAHEADQRGRKGRGRTASPEERGTAEEATEELAKSGSSAHVNAARPSPDSRRSSTSSG